MEYTALKVTKIPMDTGQVLPHLLRVGFPVRSVLHNRAGSLLSFFQLRIKQVFNHVK